MRPNQASHAIISAALNVHTAFGAGLLESTHQACLHYELQELGLRVEQQIRLPVTYKQVRLPIAYRVDFIVENCVIVEVKAVEKLLPVHTAQVISYLRLTGLKLALLLDFNVRHMRDGIHRIINGPEQDL